MWWWQNYATWYRVPSIMMPWLVLIGLSIASLSEIQNARGIMDVLAEMLNALDPGNKEVSSSIQTLNFWCTWVIKIFWSSGPLPRWKHCMVYAVDLKEGCCCCCKTFIIKTTDSIECDIFCILFSGSSAGSYCWFSGAMSNIQAESGTPC